MAMRQCERCLENGWTFECIEGFVMAVCKHCGFEVQFPARKRKSLKPSRFALDVPLNNYRDNAGEGEETPWD